MMIKCLNCHIQFEYNYLCCCSVNCEIYYLLTNASDSILDYVMRNSQRHTSEQLKYHTLLFNNQKIIVNSFECNHKRRINFTKVYLSKHLIKDIANIVMSY